jgi:hypothetical protein
MITLQPLLKKKPTISWLARKTCYAAADSDSDNHFQIQDLILFKIEMHFTGMR